MSTTLHCYLGPEGRIEESQNYPPSQEQHIAATAHGGRWVRMVPEVELLDQFAMAALSGILSHPDTSNTPNEVAHDAMAIAHAMLARRP